MEYSKIEIMIIKIILTYRIFFKTSKIEALSVLSKVINYTRI